MGYKRCIESTFCFYRNYVIIKSKQSVICYNQRSMKEMCTRNELNLILQAMTQAYQAVYGANVVKIILYGSYARGDYQKDSDIDIVAIVQGDREKLQQGLKSVWDISSDLELEYGTIVSPTVIPFAEYEKYKNDLPYYRNIESEGVEIVA